MGAHGDACTSVDVSPKHEDVTYLAILELAGVLEFVVLILLQRVFNVWGAVVDRYDIVELDINYFVCCDSLAHRGVGAQTERPVLPL